MAYKRHNCDKQIDFNSTCGMYNDDPPEDIHFRELAPGIECVCWMIVLLSAFLRFANGAAISTAQSAVQIMLLSFAAGAAIGLRTYNYLNR